MVTVPGFTVYGIFYLLLNRKYRLLFDQKIDEYDKYEDFPGYKLVLSKEMLHECSDKSVFYIYHAIALKELVRYGESQQYLSQAMELCPKDKDKYCIFAENGHVCHDSKDYKNAIVWFQKAIEVDPDYISGHTYLGSALACMGDLESAEKRHRISTQCAKGCIDEAFLNLGYALRAQERYEDALKCFKKAIEIDPDYQDAKEAAQDIQSALCFLSQGREGGYQDKYERLRTIRDLSHAPCLQFLMARELVEDYPDYWDAEIQYAMNLIDFVRYESAGIILEKAIEDGSEYELPMSYYAMGRLYEAKGEYKHAKEWFTKSIEMNPQDAYYRLGLGKVLYQQGKHEDAAKCFENATLCPEGNVDDAYYHLGLVLRSQENISDALKCFEKALAMNPEHEEAPTALEDMRKVANYNESKRG